ncbi:lysophospholipase [Sporolactobacillus shoreicorticis]|uniref:Alpha/beta hydrolase n=1 Tax=Sporolactobacillus shoreicorticis TaxID=1923877 RepID=A0ABW5S2D6_9BACL|nr:alpha/beta fold hydrolase [Sporolactobacillus shoreicorticis]MCO7127872.1 lysophospholipase [Sporolactobacillus shoreicorticis]
MRLISNQGDQKDKGKNNRGRLKTKILLVSGILTAAAAVFKVTESMIGSYFYRLAIAREDSPHRKNLDPAVSKEHLSPAIKARIDERKAVKERFLRECPPVDVSFNASDGLKLHACRFNAHPEGHRWIVLLHGYMNEASFMFYYASVFADHGFNALVPDLRGAGQSEGEYIGMGWNDRFDVVGWIQEIIKWDPQAQIVIFGVSMGAATAMMTAGEKLPEHVVCVIEDCGYTSVADEFAYELHNLFRLPSFPILHFADRVTRSRAGYGIFEASAVEQLKKAKIPILFIHGDKDTFVPTSMVHKVYEAAAGDKELLLVKGATHAAASLVDPDLYFSTIFRFVEKYMSIRQ